ncbi:MAG: TrmB family transcriptional regulator [Candidatus Woesearchaeota archaeon]
MDNRLEYSELGLTVNETKVYETLLRLGKSTAGHISKESHVPYGRIYNVLASLEEKGLIKVLPEDTKRYVPADPQKLHDIIDIRIKNLMEIDNKVKELKKIYEEHDIEPVIMAKGKSNFYKIEREKKSPERYNYSIKYTFEANPIWLRETRDRIKKGIEIKSIGLFNKETDKAIKEWKTITKEIKPIENDGVAVGIVDDEEVMIALIKSNTTLLIRDKAFAKIMKQLFIKYYMNTDYEEPRE